MLEKFHRATKINQLFDDYENDIGVSEQNFQIVKIYPRFPSIPLHSPALPESHQLFGTLMKRHSQRDFRQDPIPMVLLSTLLYYSAGSWIEPDKGVAHRMYPSACRSYPLEIYTIITAGDLELPTGIYHYAPLIHSLEKLTCDVVGGPSEETENKLPMWAKQAPVLLVATAFLHRATEKHGLRGYRYALQETGHLGQNIYLVSSVLGLGCCLIGNFNDYWIESLLNIQKKEEVVLSVFAVGFTKH